MVATNRVRLDELASDLVGDNGLRLNDPGPDGVGDDLLDIGRAGCELTNIERCDHAVGEALLNPLQAVPPVFDKDGARCFLTTTGSVPGVVATKGWIA